MSKPNNYIYKLLHWLHIYGGLFAAVYLVMIGVSSLNYQHRFFPEHPVDTISYQENIGFDATLEIDTLASFIRNELGIKGYLPKWEFRDNKKNGRVRFKIERPALTYEIKLNRNDGLVSVDEIHYSFGKILRALHFGGVRNQLGDPLLDIWSWYGQLSGLFAFFAVVTGIYFWFRNAVRNRGQWITIMISGIVSILYILYIWLVG